MPVHFSDGDPALLGKLDMFYASLGPSQYFAGAVGEYGVGPATVAPTVSLAEMAPKSTDDASIQAWLAGKLNGNDAAFPSADAGTVYVIDYPHGTTIDFNGSKSCQAFGGYHSNLVLDAAHQNRAVPYVVLPTCNTTGALDALTDTASSMIAAAVTDPYPLDTPAYASFDGDHIAWAFVFGTGEISVCSSIYSPVTTTDVPFAVSRTWSNKAAAAGHDPCVPAPSGAYFNAAPVLGSVTLPMIGTTLGVDVPLGGKKVVELDLFSDGDTGGPFNVKVVDAAMLMGGAPHLTLSLDKSSGQNGEKLMLTVQVDSIASGKVEWFVVEATQGKRVSYWIGVVHQN